MTFGAVVVGLGQIGMGFDLKLDPAAHILTHARAFQQHPAFQLIGGVDPDVGRRQLFEDHYGGRAYADIDAAMEALRPDVVAVATPTELHCKTVRSILKARVPTAILCEKPLSFEIDEAQGIVDACREGDCQLYANYIRRSDPGVAEVKRRLLEGDIARPVKGVVWYSKGLFNNGSHFLNLLQYWLGDVHEIRVVKSGRLWGGLDPEPDLIVSFVHGSACFLAACEENFSHYTIELIAPNGRLRYEHGGDRIVWQATTSDAACEGYTVLSPIEEIIKTDLARTQWHVVDQMAADLEGRQARICSGIDALRTLEALTAIREDL